MKKLFTLLFLTFSCCLITFKASAQSTYKTAAGLELEFGKGNTLAGPTLKNFFNNHQALQVDVLLGSNYFSLGAFYQYHLFLKKENPLKFYLGAGPELYVGVRNNSGFLLRPMAGFDYKITKLPISITADIRPSLMLSGQSEFEAARFNIGARYAFK